MSSVVLFIIVAILFLLGLLGTLLPALPGIGLIFVGVGVYAVVTGFSVVTIPHLLIFGLVTIAATGLNYFGSLVGTRAGGGGKLAIAGTIIGAIMGLATIGPLGLFVGSFLGALAGALAEGKEGLAATKTALYSVVGIIGGTLIQLGIGVTMIIAFILLII